MSARVVVQLEVGQAWLAVQLVEQIELEEVSVQ